LHRRERVETEVRLELTAQCRELGARKLLAQPYSLRFALREPALRFERVIDR